MSNGTPATASPSPLSKDRSLKRFLRRKKGDGPDTSSLDESSPSPKKSPKNRMFRSLLSVKGSAERAKLKAGSLRSVNDVSRDEGGDVHKMKGKSVLWRVNQKKQATSQSPVLSDSRADSSAPTLTSPSGTPPPPPNSEEAPLLDTCAAPSTKGQRKGFELAKDRKRLHEPIVVVDTDGVLENVGSPHSVGSDKSKISVSSASREKEETELSGVYEDASAAQDEQAPVERRRERSPGRHKKGKSANDASKEVGSAGNGLKLGADAVHGRSKSAPSERPRTLSPPRTGWLEGKPYIVVDSRNTSPALVNHRKDASSRSSPDTSLKPAIVASVPYSQIDVSVPQIEVDDGGVVVDVEAAGAEAVTTVDNHFEHVPVARKHRMLLGKTHHQDAPQNHASWLSRLSPRSFRSREGDEGGVTFPSFRSFRSASPKSEKVGVREEHGDDGYDTSSGFESLNSSNSDDGCQDALSGSEHEHGFNGRSRTRPPIEPIDFSRPNRGGRKHRHRNKSPYNTDDVEPDAASRLHKDSKKRQLRKQERIAADENHWKRVARGGHWINSVSRRLIRQREDRSDDEGWHLRLSAQSGHDMCDEEDDAVDPVTGQALFKPVISKRSEKLAAQALERAKREHVEKGLDYLFDDVPPKPHERLYDEHKQRLDWLTTVQAITDSLSVQDSSIAGASASSLRILARKLRREAAHLFLKSDTHGHGFIQLSGLEVVLDGLHALPTTNTSKANLSLPNAKDSTCCDDAAIQNIRQSLLSAMWDMLAEPLNLTEGDKDASASDIVMGIKLPPLADLLVCAMHGGDAHTPWWREDSESPEMMDLFRTLRYWRDDYALKASVFMQNKVESTHQAPATTVHKQVYDESWRRIRAAQSERRKLLEEARQRVEVQEMAGVTFKPRINNHSTSIVRRRASRIGDTQSHRTTKLANDKKAREQAAASILLSTHVTDKPRQKSQEERELALCTFKPKLPGTENFLRSKLTPTPVEPPSPRSPRSQKSPVDINNVENFAVSQPPVRQTEARRRTWTTSVERIKEGRLKHLSDYALERALDLRPGGVPKGMAELFTKEGMPLPPDGDDLYTGVPFQPSKYHPPQITSDTRLLAKRARAAEKSQDAALQASAQALDRANRKAVLRLACQRAASKASLENTIAARGGTLPLLVVEVELGHTAGTQGWNRHFLPLWNNSHPVDDVRKFGEKHRLSEDAIIALAESLSEQFYAAVQASAALGEYSEKMVLGVVPHLLLRVET